MQQQQRYIKQAAAGRGRMSPGGLAGLCKHLQTLKPFHQELALAVVDELVEQEDGNDDVAGVPEQEQLLHAVHAVCHQVVQLQRERQLFVVVEPRRHGAQWHRQQRALVVTGVRFEHLLAQLVECKAGLRGIVGVAVRDGCAEEDADEEGAQAHGAQGNERIVTDDDVNAIMARAQPSVDTLDGDPEHYEKHPGIGCYNAVMQHVEPHDLRHGVGADVA